MSEVRNAHEGKLYWIAASGSGGTFATASAASGYLFAYVDAFTHTSAQSVTQIMDRGTLSHHKKVGDVAHQVSFTIKEGITGQYPNPASGSGASVPMFHLEFKQLAPEDAAVTGIYYHFNGCVATQMQFTEGAESNTRQYTVVALGYDGPTGSGYLA